MADNRHFSDPDIREALHNKYNSEVIPCLTDDFMDKVIARADQCRHASTSKFRKAVKAISGIAASIIVAGACPLIFLNYRSMKSSSGNLSAVISPNRELALPDLEPVIPSAQDDTDKDKQLTSTVSSFSSAANTVSSQKLSKGNKAIDKTSSAIESKGEPATKPTDNGNIEYYTPETRQMLSARFDRGREQADDLRAIIENNQLNNINK